MSEDYRIKLDAFEGPLDLLLFLIRKHEVDIHDIPIAQITDQYLAYVAQLHATDAHRLDIDEAGEFLVMAATLTEIKSRMLLPKPEGSESSENGAPAGPAEDPRAELVRQLIEYKRYRDAADALEQRGEQWSRRFGGGRAQADQQAMAQLQALEQDAAELDLGDLELIDLVAAFQRIADTVNFDKLGEHQVTYDDTPLELHAADILQRLQEREARGRRGDEIELRDMLAGRTRGEMVGLFLALLELVRSGKVGVRQDKVDGSILLHTREEAAPTLSGATGTGPDPDGPPPQG